jgi:hypothetical protein
MSDVSTHATLPTNLVSYWELEESSGTRADSHGSYDLTDTNTVGQITGIQGSGADFNNAASEYLISGTGFGTALGSSVTAFSISFWFNADTVNDNDGVIYIGNFTGSQGEFNIHLGASNLMQTLFDGGAKSSGFAMTDTTNWHHYAMSYNGSNYTIWLDNVKKFDAVAYNATLNFTGLKMVLGGYYDNRFLYNGALDEVGVWNKALSASEVSDLYNSGTGLPYSSGGAPTTYNEARRLHMMMM